MWEEYEEGSSNEAVDVKALDKIETLMQHNQGRNPPGFDYAFNLTYGLSNTNALPEIAELRSFVDRETKEHMKKNGSCRDAT